MAQADPEIINQNLQKKRLPKPINYLHFKIARLGVARDLQPAEASLCEQTSFQTAKGRPKPPLES